MLSSTPAADPEIKVMSFQRGPISGRQPLQKSALGMQLPFRARAPGPP